VREIDLRHPENLSLNFSKSINLALSERGINGLRNLGDGGKLLEEVLAETIPMYGRMIHSGKPEDKGQSQKYDVHGRVGSPLSLTQGEGLTVEM
jgi:kynurenine 3-monooxygenase